MAEHTDQRRRPRTGVYPGTFEPIHNGHLDIIRRATLFDVAEDERVVAVVRLVGAAEPNEPGGGGDPNEPEPFRSTNPAAAIQTNPRATTGSGRRRMAPIMADHTDQRRRPRTGVYPGRSTPSTTVISTSSAARPCLTLPRTSTWWRSRVWSVPPSRTNPSQRSRPNESGGGGDPNEPESYDGIGPTPDGADHG